MCLLKLNHHDLTSKIHTVKSYKVTQAEDEIKRSKWTLRISCTICAPYLAHAQSFFSSVQARTLNGFGTGRLREESQGLLFSFFTFLRPIFFLARLDFFPPPLTAPGSPRMTPNRNFRIFWLNGKHPFFLDWFKFESRPSSLRNSGTVN